MTDRNISTDERNLPAFPFVIDSGAIEPGLTKRELFAAMAMQGSLGGVPGSHLVPPNLAEMSVKYADALLAALDVSKESTRAT